MSILPLGFQAAFLQAVLKLNLGSQVVEAQVKVVPLCFLLVFSQVLSWLR